MAMSERVKISVSDHIAEVVLSRPEKMNALDQSGFEQLAHASQQIKNNSSVRVVILRAEGDHFCAGADKSFLQGAVSDNALFRKRALDLPQDEIANEFQKPAMGWLELDVPVVVCLQGVVYGAGMQVALAGDIRIAAPTTAMSLFEIHWGLVPDMGITQTLPKLVRADVGMDLVLSGRVVKAPEALEIGLVTRVVDDPLTSAREWAKQIAAKSPDAIRQGKRLMRDCGELTRAQGLAFEAQLQSELVGTTNQMEAAMANLEKRSAQFQ